MSQPLIIIDMQSQFLRGDFYSSCINSIIREIKLAIRRNDYIIFVEYVSSRRRIANKRPSSDPTIAPLRAAVKGYRKVLYVYKKNDDGGKEVLRTLRDKRISKFHVRVCGVYASHCVADTVNTLAKKMTQSIYLIDSGISCYEDYIPYKKSALSNLTWLHENVFIKK